MIKRDLAGKWDERVWIFGVDATFYGMSAELQVALPETQTLAGSRWLTDGSVSAVAGGGSVPEPATWAMMIAGFGVVGAAMRRRKVRVRFA